MKRFVLSVTVPVVAFAGLLLGQSPKAWVHPKTPWGDPDIQGVWPGNVGVPMQRPQNLGERTTLTDEEFAQREAQAKRQAEADSQSHSLPATLVRESVRRHIGLNAESQRVRRLSSSILQTDDCRR